MLFFSGSAHTPKHEFRAAFVAIGRERGSAPSSGPSHSETSAAFQHFHLCSQSPPTFRQAPIQLWCSDTSAVVWLLESSRDALLETSENQHSSF